MILTNHSVTSEKDIIRYSRWARTILLVVFHRDGKGDEERAGRFVLQAKNVLRTSKGREVCPTLTLVYGDCLSAIAGLPARRSGVALGTDMESRTAILQVSIGSSVAK